MATPPLSPASVSVTPRQEHYRRLSVSASVSSAAATPLASPLPVSMAAATCTTTSTALEALAVAANSSSSSTMPIEPLHRHTNTDPSYGRRMRPLSLRSSSSPDIHSCQISKMTLADDQTPHGWHPGLRRMSSSRKKKHAHHPHPRHQGAVGDSVDQDETVFIELDATLPTPNIYDIALTLSSDTGLDAWWSNAVAVLRESYGAERLSLSVPSDASDPEKSPWLQKATYGASVSSSRSKKAAPRPNITGRHSFAGNLNYARESLLFEHAERRKHRRKSLSTEDWISLHADRDGTAVTTTDPSEDPDCRCPAVPPTVFPGPRSLKAEKEPLIEHPFITKLFGRAAPVVLTREFCAVAVDSRKPKSKSRRYSDSIQAVPGSNFPVQYAEISQSGRTSESEDNNNNNSNKYETSSTSEQYELSTTSPWTQSPAPSPAPSSNPDINPFFSDFLVNKEIMTNLPPHMHCIDVGSAKSLVHIPLLYSHPSRKPTPSSDSQWFPLAIISFLTSRIPFHSDLTNSLTLLIPHLTTTYSQAQKYTLLQNQVKNQTPPQDNISVSSRGSLRNGPVFSDESGTKKALETPISLQIPSVSSPISSGGLLSPEANRQSSGLSNIIAQLALKSLPAQLFLAKPHTGEIVWANAEFNSYRRCHYTELRPRNIWDGVHPTEIDSVSEKWLMALQFGVEFTERLQIRNFDNEPDYRSFMFHASPLNSDTGRILYWLGSLFEAPEHHVTGLRIPGGSGEGSKADEKYKEMVNTMPEIAFEVSEQGGLLTVSDYWCLYTGQTQEEALSSGFSKFIHHNDLTGHTFTFAPRPTSNIGGTPNYHSYAANMPPSAPADHAKNLSAASFKIEPEKERMISTNNVAVALQDLVEAGKISAKRSQNGRRMYTSEARIKAKTGEYRWHLVRFTEADRSDPEHEDPRWYGVCTDINEQKLRELESELAVQRLNAEMETKNKFFINMSHEFRTPLNGIMGTTSLILDMQIDNDQRRMLDTVQNCSNNLNELVNTLLDVSKVEAGKMNIVREWFHVRSILEDTIDTVSSRAISKGLEINYLVDAEVPLMVFGDMFCIRQVLINLMGNAIKFTAQGEIYTRCSIHIDPEIQLGPSEFLLNFEVVDTGNGFSAKDAEQLMQRFSQIGSSGWQQHEGSGLGLFLSKQLVEMHGGLLTPTSKEGKGASFSFFVKVEAPSKPSPTVGRNHPDVSPIDSPRAAKLEPSKRLDAHIPVSPLNTTTSVAKFPPPYHPTNHYPEVLSSPTTLNQAFGTGKSYTTLIVCPLDFARQAIRQHIEQVTPDNVHANIISVIDVEDYKEFTEAADRDDLTHLILGSPDASDVIEAMQLMLHCKQAVSPIIIIIADIYLKQEIATHHQNLLAAGKQVVIIPKPVKPSMFAAIFDPKNECDLSRDRTARDLLSQGFKNIAKTAKEFIGNKGHRVLLVDDNEMNRKVILKWLEKIDLVSDAAVNGQECTDMVFSKELGYYSLIICDIQMPIKDGHEACREIRAWEEKLQAPERTPIMALSANATRDQINDAAKAGFSEYLTKPVKHNELLKMMMDLLDPTTPHVLLKYR